MQWRHWGEPVKKVKKRGDRPLAGALTAVSTKKRDPNQLTVAGKPGEDQADALARTLLQPTVQAAFTLKEYVTSAGDVDLSGLIDSLTEQTRACSEGDLKRPEAMLTAQAHTLDAIFNNLARRAINTEDMNQLEPYLKLALRAQSQCRATWEALATIKNPPVMGYVRQANVAHGPQQVNNASVAPNNVPRAGKAQSVKQTMGGERWRTAGARSGGRAKPS